MNAILTPNTSLKGDPANGAKTKIDRGASLRKSHVQPRTHDVNMEGSQDVRLDGDSTTP